MSPKIFDGRFGELKDSHLVGHHGNRKCRFLLLKKQRVSVFPRVIPFSSGVWQSGRGRLDPSSLSGSEPHLESSFGGSAVAHKESFDAFETIARRISGNGRRGGERGGGVLRRGLYLYL